MEKRDILHNRKKTIITILAVVIAVFFALNAVWFIWRSVRFSKYTDKMEKGMLSSFFVPRYTCSDDDGFTYYVKYPDYLTTTGNLSLAAPTEELNGLLIWLGADQNYEYGVIITDNAERYEIYVDANGDAVSKEDEQMIKQNKELVDLLFEKANAFWNLR